jgi:hypothetical protein
MTEVNNTFRGETVKAVEKFIKTYLINLQYKN